MGLVREPWLNRICKRDLKAWSLLFPVSPALRETGLGNSYGAQARVHPSGVRVRRPSVSSSRRASLRLLVRTRKAARRVR